MIATRTNTLNAADQGSEDPELGFDPESPDVSDPAVDPLHPALTDNDPDPEDREPEESH